MPWTIVNKPTVLSTAPITTQRMTIMTDGSGSTANVYIPGATTNLILADASALDGSGTVLMSIRSRNSSLARSTD
jgi:hypothetical protein